MQAEYKETIGHLRDLKNFNIYEKKKFVLLYLTQAQRNIPDFKNVKRGKIQKCSLLFAIPDIYVLIYFNQVLVIKPQQQLNIKKESHQSIAAVLRENTTHIFPSNLSIMTLARGLARVYSRSRSLYHAFEPIVEALLPL